MAVEPRVLYTCAARGCDAAGGGFTDEPGFCALCLEDLAGVYDTTGTLRTDDELRVVAGSTGGETHGD